MLGFLMLLTGTFERSLDDKLRFAIPKRLRDLIIKHEPASVMYLAPGTDGSLALYPESSFNRMAAQLDQSAPNSKDVRAFSRMFFTQAQHLELDRQGRIRIPPELARFASLTKEVVLLGVRDHLEIWDREKWHQYFNLGQAKYDFIAESAFSGTTQSGLPERGPDPMTQKTEPDVDETDVDEPEQANTDIPNQPR